MIRRALRGSLYLALVCAVAAATAQDAAQASASASAAASAAASGGTEVQLVAPVIVADPLIKTDVVVGGGKEAESGSTVVVHYTGWLYKPMLLKQRGKQFDSSREAGRTPFDFRLGAGQVIKGWDQGVVGMKVGGKRTLIIPAPMAYGPRSMGDIPANAALIFDVELLEVK
ncbi:FKBP-type peptidyl-prolyl cis-trans isomerase [Massilia glaciei]|uniref:Peptidyl-prolyl cis-trans isomerase n=1 Tax=Massilia glaciei TaxID=1524097 RepID=A0A2U2I5S5_9BURK|nr:FKBP-type peptidyl-prolyl cis-trans isomerase [Massilia glaciei]PWF55107.1 peptidylprolyl isomerase [Massilia glaciei]